MNRKRNPVPLICVFVVAKSFRFGASRPTRSLAAGLCLTIVSLLHAADPVPGRLAAGATFETLQAGKTTYQQVQVRSVNARTVMILHAGGIASVRLRDLSPELQAAFGYDPAAEAGADSALKEAQARAEQARAKENQTRAADAAKGAASNGRFERLLQSFGQPPEIRPSVDLRPKFFALELNVKNQGPRPSCAVFAIVSALEFQNAQLTGQADHFSEEYLLWATCKTLNRAPRVAPDAPGAESDNPETQEIADEGFSLTEVVTALRAYGVPLQASLPYSLARNATVDPQPSIIAEARTHRRVSIYQLPGREPPARLANLVQALNEGVPVVVGLRWPPWRTLGKAYLDLQRPMEGGGHAVTIVGYENQGGTIMDTVFIFKNSWGPKWGAGGYGRASYAYLMKNLEETALLEVEPAVVAPHIAR